MRVCPKSYIQMSPLLFFTPSPLCSENIITLSSLKWVISCVEDSTTAVLWLLNGTEQWSMEPLGERAGTNFNPGMDQWLQTHSHTYKQTHTHIHKHRGIKGWEWERDITNSRMSAIFWSHIELQNDHLLAQNNEGIHVSPNKRGSHTLISCSTCVVNVTVDALPSIYLSKNFEKQYYLLPCQLQSLSELLNKAAVSSCLILSD